MTVLLILAGQVIIVNFGGMMFNVTPLELEDWIILFAASSFVMWIGEIVHLFLRRQARLKVKVTTRNVDVLSVDVKIGKPKK